mgnify:CR=1 FL=1|tara:strand:- start:338 stop:595 length:258 start_codon:yes stop_codon:yes gene_type:complete
MERPLKMRRLHSISVNQLMDEYYIFSTNYMNTLENFKSTNEQQTYIIEKTKKFLRDFIKSCENDNQVSEETYGHIISILKKLKYR